MTDLELIREVIIRSNPEIVELKFGCELLMNYGEDYNAFWVIAQTGICNRHKKTHDTCYDPDGKCVVEDGYELISDPSGDDGWFTFSVTEERLKEQNAKIIGRPIRLADILLAIQKAIITFDIGLAGNICYHWNLRDDSLEEQSPETLKFIASILEDKSNR